MPHWDRERDSGTTERRDPTPPAGRESSSPAQAWRHPIDRLRDGAAGWLVARGVSPDALTIAGLLLAVPAAGCLAAGAGDAPPWDPPGAGGLPSLWPLAAAGWLLLSGLMDVLDGACARVAGRASPRGALLDANADRVADALPWLGCVAHFAARGQATLAALAALALAAGGWVPYARARGEAEGTTACGGGTWQRPTRCLVAIAGMAMGHVPALLWLLATAPALTFLGRVQRGWRDLDPARMRGASRAAGPRTLGRGILAAGILLALAAAPHLHPWLAGTADPLGDWLLGR